MNNKGFTLIELIATIALLAVISVISFVSINAILEQSKVSDCESLFTNIETAVKEYVSDNRYNDSFVNDVKVINNENIVEITANDLLGKYLKGNLIDPFNGDVIDATKIYISVFLKDDYSFDRIIVKNSSGEEISKDGCKNKVEFNGLGEYNPGDDEKLVCTLEVNNDGVNLNVLDNGDIVEMGMSTSNNKTYNGVTSLPLSIGTIYGYVKDDNGNEGSCTVDIKNLQTLYTCRQNRVYYTSIACSKDNYNVPSSACPTNYPYYSSNTCSYEPTYERRYYRCSYINNEYTFVEETGYDYGTLCPSSISVCNANTVGQQKVTCTPVSPSSYDGTISCYGYASCTVGTNEGDYCYLYNQNSCDSGWSIYNNSKSCMDGYTKINDNYCYMKIN